MAQSVPRTLARILKFVAAAPNGVLPWSQADCCRVLAVAVSCGASTVAPHLNRMVGNDWIEVQKRGTRVTSYSMLPAGEAAARELDYLVDGSILTFEEAVVAVWPSEFPRTVDPDEVAGSASEDDDDEPGDGFEDDLDENKPASVYHPPARERSQVGWKMDFNRRHGLGGAWTQSLSSKERAGLAPSDESLGPEDN